MIRVVVHSMALNRAWDEQALGCKAPPSLTSTIAFSAGVADRIVSLVRAKCTPSACVQLTLESARSSLCPRQLHTAHESRKIVSEWSRG